MENKGATDKTFKIKELPDGWEGVSDTCTQAITCNEDKKWSYAYEDDTYDDDDTKAFKACIREYIENECEPDLGHKWEIQKARFFGYNETTLALIKAPDEQHYLVRTACYPFGNPSKDSSVLGFEPSEIGSRKELHWNDLLDEIAGEEHDIEAMALELKALPFIPCETNDPIEEFEELAEIERFMSRKSLADKYDVTHENTCAEPRLSEHINVDTQQTFAALSGLMGQFQSAAGYASEDMAKTKPPPKPKSFSLYEIFTRTDLQRDRWYGIERHPYEEATKYLPHGKSHLSMEEVKDTIELICKDFGIPCPKKTSISKHNPRRRSEGSYNNETTHMRLMQAPYNQGVPYDLLIHEMAHHINNVYKDESDDDFSTAHGYRFKKIHMHLMHHYAGIPVQTLLDQFQDCYRASWIYETPLTLREQDITHRDFTETRTWDILPVEPKDKSEKIPFRDFNPLDQVI